MFQHHLLYHVNMAQLFQDIARLIAFHHLTFAFVVFVIKHTCNLFLFIVFGYIYFFVISLFWNPSVGVSFLGLGAGMGFLSLQGKIVFLGLIVDFSNLSAFLCVRFLVLWVDVDEHVSKNMVSICCLNIFS